MSYTLNYTGSEIDDILDRAAPGGAIDQALAAKQDVLTFDAVPTEGSTNPAESGGIYDAIQAGGAAALAAFATDTVSGDVVSFPDGADGIPVKAFTGSIIPQQNLNGQSAPYPAGGGKNKVDADTAYASYKTAANNYQTTASNFNTINITIPDSLVGTACTFSAYLSPNASTSNFRVQVQTGGSTYDGNTIAGGSSGYSSVTFTPASGFSIAKLTYGSGGGQTATVKDVQLEIGSSRTAWTPYANICPISGWTGANIYRIKMEQGSYSAESGNIDVSTRIRSNGWIKQTGGAITVTLSPSNYEWIVFNADSADGANAASIGGWSNSGATGTVLKQYIKIIVRNKTNPSADITPADVVAKIDGIDPTVAITFGSTVYAGTLTALGGGLWKIQPTHGVITYNGAAAESWTLEASGRCYIENDALAKLDDYSTAILCDKLKTVERNGVMSSTDYCISGYKDSGGSYPTRNWIYAKADDTITSANAFKTWLAANPITVLYPLTDASKPDPITITGEDLQTLLGANTVWLDCGSVTGMTYRADTSLYIDKKLGA